VIGGKLQLKMSLLLKKLRKQEKHYKCKEMCGYIMVKVGKQGRDVRIKEFSIQSSLYIFMEKDVCRWVIYYTELFFANISLPCFPTFYCSAIPTSPYILKVLLLLV